MQLAPQPRTPGTPRPVLFYNGNILTGCQLPGAPAFPGPARTAALLVRGEHVAAIGEAAIAAAREDPRIARIDLHGRFCMPGFNDSHVHLALAGRQRLAVDLSSTRSLPAMQARIATAAAQTPAGEWLLGGGWDQTSWPGGQLPTRHDLDRVTPHHPALFHRVDAHIAVGNSAALALASITRDTPDPPAASIDRDPHGTPTGILREPAATRLVLDLIGPPTGVQRRAALTFAIKEAAAHGVTSVQDNSDWDDFLVLEQMAREGALPVRVSEWLDFTLPLDTLVARRRDHPPIGHHLRLTHLKGFLDGALGSRTAALSEPYADDPSTRGLPRFQPDDLRRMILERSAAGFQIGLHAIGDAAVSMALDAFEGTAAAGIPLRDLRPRIEHAQVVHPRDLPRFHHLGVLASMQPAHLLTDMQWVGDRLGPGRSPWAYAWRSFLHHQVPVAFGTDFPVESVSPLRSLYAATTRTHESGSGVFVPLETLSLGQAIYAYTHAAAHAEFTEQEKGRLVPGMLADFVLLDRDITAVPFAELLNTQVLATVVGGHAIYDQAGELSKSAPA